MKRTLSACLAGLALTACLAQPCLAQNSWDYTSSSEYKGIADSLKLTTEQRDRLDNTLPDESEDFAAVFEHEHHELELLLKPEQLSIYDQEVKPSNYFVLGLLNPDEWSFFRNRLTARLNLTPDQVDCWRDITRETTVGRTNVNYEYEELYTGSLNGHKWRAFRNKVTSPYALVFSLTK